MYMKSGTVLSFAQKDTQSYITKPICDKIMVTRVFIQTCG